jgi:hypothetical protein
MIGVKKIQIQIDSEDGHFVIDFLSKQKIVQILGDKKTSISDFFKDLLQLKI